MHVENSASNPISAATPPVSETELLSDQEAPTPRARRRRTWLRFFADIGVYLVIYVVVAGVSIGPLFWVWFGAVYVNGPKWFARLYLPLALLCEICPPLSWLVNTWINWWIL